MNITDIQRCARYYQKNYLETFYIVSTYHGKVSLERALAQSLNIPALEAMQAVTNAVGNDYMREYMKKLGFDDKVAEKFDLLYAIGGANFEATPTQMAAAFATLANGGKYIEPQYDHKGCI